MMNENDLAILSIHAYRVGDGEVDAPLISGDWTALKSCTARSLSFAHAVYKNTTSGKIVNAYRGIDRGMGDWLINSGLIFSQESQAANCGENFCVGADRDTSYYKFRSCSRLYLLGKSPTRYCKAAEKPSPKACASRRHARGRILNTPNSIAGYASKRSVTGIFDDGGAI